MCSHSAIKYIVTMKNNKPTLNNALEILRKLI
jgi:hypothetical protein